MERKLTCTGKQLLTYNTPKQRLISAYYILKNRTKWWSHVVKNTFLNCGVQDSAALDSVAQQLIELYNTLEGWEVIPGKLVFIS